MEFFNNSSSNLNYIKYIFKHCWEGWEVRQLLKSKHLFIFISPQLVSTTSYCSAAADLTWNEGIFIISDDCVLRLPIERKKYLLAEVFKNKCSEMCLILFRFLMLLSQTYRGHLFWEFYYVLLHFTSMQWNSLAWIWHIDLKFVMDLRH